MRPLTLGGREAVKDTMPVKPRLVNVMVDVPDLPAGKLKGDTVLAVTVNSGTTVRSKVALRDSDP